MLSSLLSRRQYVSQSHFLVTASGKFIVGSEILTAVSMNASVFWVVTPFNWEIARLLEGTNTLRGYSYIVTNTAVAVQ
jgi:hypothetical protein